MIKFTSKPASLLHHQQGAALILLFLAILMTGTVVFVTSISMNRGRIQSDVETTQALSKAKEALISFAVGFYESREESSPFDPLEGLYGFLPCPNINGTDGQAAGVCSSQYMNSIGRLPWRTLDLKPLKDASGECLWYAVSGEYKFGNDPTRSDLHNADSMGMLRLFDENLNLLHGATPEDRVVAVIIAPGRPLPGQTRPDISQNIPANSVSDCTIQPAVAVNAIGEYLENFNGVNNSDVDAVTNDQIDDFITVSSSVNAGLNDRILVVTTGEIFDAIRRQTRYQQRFERLTEALATCLAEYGKHNGLPVDPSDHRLPYPAEINLNGADYRSDDSYIESSSAGMPGRFPYNVSTSSNNTNNETGTNFLQDKNYCNSLNVDGVTINLTDASNEYRRLWHHWKDHFFYALSPSFNSTVTPPTPNGGTCTDCLTVNSGSDRYAAIVLFSGRRLVDVNQRRQSPETENPPSVTPAFADSKADIRNYLEGDNIDLDRDFQTGVETVVFNDIAYCITTDMTVSLCP